MDYNNHSLTNSTGNLSPMFGNSFASAPSPCPEPVYNIQSGPNSLVNLPCCISPQGSSFSNFSPGRHTADVTSSQTLRYHPYPPPPFDPYVDDVELRKHATRNLFANDGGSEVYEKWLHPQLNYQRNIQMHPTTGKERYDGITTVKSNVRSKKGTKVSKTKNSSKRNSPAQSIDNNRQINFHDPNIVPNHVPTRVVSENYSARSINYNPQTNYDPNVILNNVPNEVMFQNNFSAQSIGNNPRTNYNPNFVLQNAPNTGMFQGNFSEQSIYNNPPTNYYDPNIVPYHVSRNVMPKGNFPEQLADNNLQPNYNPNVVLNHLPSTEVSVANKEEQCSMANEQNHAAGKYYSPVQVTEGNIDETKISAVNSTVAEEINFMTCENKDFNTQPQNDLLQRIFAATVLSDTDVADIQQLNSLDLSDYQDIQQLNSLDLSDYQTTHVTMPENSTLSIQDIRQENLENIDLSSYSFDPIFEEGENGKDMLVLLVNSNVVLSSAQQVDDGKDKTGVFVDNQNSEIRNSRAVLNSISDNTEVSNETLLEPQVHEVNNEMSENMFFSRIDDYASEETVTTSKRKYVRTKQNNNKRDKSSDENVNQNSRGNYTTSYGTSQPSTSSESEKISTNTSHHANSSSKRRKFGNFRFKHRMVPWWRRRHQRYYVEPIRHIQCTFIKKFIRRVRTENEHRMASEKFWNSYRMIVSQIGGGVMQAMYNILPALIRNSRSSAQKTNATASKSTKNL